QISRLHPSDEIAQNLQEKSPVGGAASSPPAAGPSEAESSGDLPRGISRAWQMPRSGAWKNVADIYREDCVGPCSAREPFSRFRLFEICDTYFKILHSH